MSPALFRGWAAFTLAVLTPLIAHADERDRCASASEHAQDLRAAGKLRAARDELLQCAQQTCPALVRSDCVQWLGEVESTLPTVIIVAVDSQGRDAIAVRVLVDGKVFVDGLDGKGKAIDPGVHRIRYQTAGYDPVEETVLIREGEKDRPLQVRFQAASSTARPGPAPPTAPGPAPPEAPPRPASNGAGWVPYVLAGVGVAGLGTFAYLGIQGQVEYNRCNKLPATCTSSDVHGLAVKQAVAWTAAAVGAVSLGVAAWLFLSAQPRAPAVGIAIGAERGGPIGSIGVRF